MATVFLNGVLASTALDADVAGSTTPDQIDATGALVGGRLKGAQNQDTINYNLNGSNVVDSVFNGNDGDDSLFFFNTFGAIRSQITSTNIFGGAFDDFIGFDNNVIVGAGTRVRGNDGDDAILVQNAANGAIFNGNAGDDSIDVDAGRYGFNGSTVFGGQGGDTIDLNGDGIVDSTFKGNDGDDSIFLGGSLNASGLLINGNAGADTITTFFFPGGDLSDSAVRGGDGDDSINIAGFATANVDIFGDAGDDTIIGGNGNDDIIGGVGADSMTGGGGNDNFIFAAGDSLAATAKGAAFVTFGNGVDEIARFGFGIDTITYNGTTFVTAALTNGTIGTATINATGDYQIATNGTAAGLYVVDGTFNPVTGVFADTAPGLATNFLFFDAGSAKTVGSTIIGTSVEALIVG